MPHPQNGNQIKSPTTQKVSMFSEALKKGAKGWLSLEPCSLTAHSSRLGIHIVPPSQRIFGLHDLSCHPRGCPSLDVTMLGNLPELAHPD